MQVGPLPAAYLDLDRAALERVGRHYLDLGRAMLAEAERRALTMERRQNHRQRLCERERRIHGLIRDMMQSGASATLAAQHVAHAEGIEPAQALALYGKTEKRLDRQRRDNRNAAIVRAWRGGRGTMGEIGDRHGLSEAQVSRIVRAGNRPT